MQRKGTADELARTGAGAQRWRDRPSTSLPSLGRTTHRSEAKLHSASEWKKRMRAYSRSAPNWDLQLSLKRGYGTLRLTPSPIKPIIPAHIGRSRWRTENAS